MGLMAVWMDNAIEQHLSDEGPPPTS